MPFIIKIMSYNRYSLLKKFIHFVDNDTFDSTIHPNPELFKIWPIFEHLNNLFVFTDKSLMLFKGGLSWKQYIPLKRSRFGIKSFL